MSEQPNPHTGGAYVRDKNGNLVRQPDEAPASAKPEGQDKRGARATKPKE